MKIKIKWKITHESQMQRCIISLINNINNPNNSYIKNECIIGRVHSCRWKERYARES